jgi:hypothetical protein
LLHEVVAEIATADDGTEQRAQLTAVLVGKDVDRNFAPVRIGFIDIPAKAGAVSIPLMALERRLRRLLDMSTDQDARIKLDLAWPASAADRRFPRITVVRHVGQVRWDRGNGTAHLELAPTPGISPLARDDMRVDAIAVNEPETQVPFQRDEAGTYRPATPLRPGPWIVLSRDPANFHMPFRAAFVQVPGDAGATADTPLHQAISLQKFQAREQAIRDVLVNLGNDPNHPSWPLVDAYLGLLDRVPADLFETVRHLASAPRALGIALFRARDPRIIVQAFARLPFHWAAFPLAALRHGFDVRTASCAASLEGAGLPKEMLADILAQDRSQAFQRVTCDIYARAPGFDPVLAAVLSSPALRLPSATALPGLRWQTSQLQPLQDVWNEARRRRPEGHEWPRLAAITSAWASLGRPAGFDRLVESAPLNDRGVLLAPLLAAIDAVTGRPVNQQTAWELTLAESADQEYFNRAHRAALSLLLASDR